jgi:hypothetical protein
MRRKIIAPVSAALLAAASLGCYALPSVNSLPLFKAKPAAPAQQPPAPARQQADLPITVYDPDISDDIAAGLPEVILAYSAEPAIPGMPVTIYDGEQRDGDDQPTGMASLPETVYSFNLPAVPTERSSARATGERSLVNEAVTQAAVAANPNGDEVETAPGQAPPASAGPSPYTHYTDAQRVGVNPCEIKNHQASPYTSLTDAQRAGQTDCY